MKIIANSRDKNKIQEAIEDSPGLHALVNLINPTIAMMNNHKILQVRNITNVASHQDYTLSFQSLPADINIILFLRDYQNDTRNQIQDDILNLILKNIIHDIGNREIEASVLIDADNFLPHLQNQLHDVTTFVETLSHFSIQNRQNGFDSAMKDLENWMKTLHYHVFPQGLSDGDSVFDENMLEYKITALAYRHHYELLKDDVTFQAFLNRKFALCHFPHEGEIGGAEDDKTTLTKNLIRYFLKQKKQSVEKYREDFYKFMSYFEENQDKNIFDLSKMITVLAQSGNIPQLRHMLSLAQDALFAEKDISNISNNLYQKISQDIGDIEAIQLFQSAQKHVLRITMLENAFFPPSKQDIADFVKISVKYPFFYHVIEGPSLDDENPNKALWNKNIIKAIQSTVKGWTNLITTISPYHPHDISSIENRLKILLKSNIMRHVFASSRTLPTLSSLCVYGDLNIFLRPDLKEAFLNHSSKDVKILKKNNFTIDMMKMKELAETHEYANKFRSEYFDGDEIKEKIETLKSLYTNLLFSQSSQYSHNFSAIEDILNTVSSLERGLFQSYVFSRLSKRIEDSRLNIFDPNELQYWVQQAYVFVKKFDPEHPLLQNIILRFPDFDKNTFEIIDEKKYIECDIEKIEKSILKKKEDIEEHMKELEALNNNLIERQEKLSLLNLSSHNIRRTL